MASSLPSKCMSSSQRLSFTLRRSCEPRWFPLPCRAQLPCLVWTSCLWRSELGTPALTPSVSPEVLAKAAGKGCRTHPLRALGETEAETGCKGHTHCQAPRLALAFQFSLYIAVISSEISIPFTVRKDMSVCGVGF